MIFTGLWQNNNISFIIFATDLNNKEVYQDVVQIFSNIFLSHKIPLYSLVFTEYSLVLLVQIMFKWLYFYSFTFIHIHSINICAPLFLQCNIVKEYKCWQI